MNGEIKPTGTTLPFPNPDASQVGVPSSSTSTQNESTVPKYKIVQRGYFDMQNFMNTR